jgi:outer membrane protein assembly factor BamA
LAYYEDTLSTAGRRQVVYLVKVKKPRQGISKTGLGFSENNDLLFPSPPVGLK